MTKPVPIHLEHYDVFRSLEDWVEATASRDPTWTIRRCAPHFACDLEWDADDRGTHVKRVTKYGNNPPEAVYLAIQEFIKHEK